LENEGEGGEGGKDLNMEERMNWIGMGNWGERKGGGGIKLKKNDGGETVKTIFVLV
jgi:hypothetical protein